MARVTYGPLVTELIGSIGGLTFQRNASGAIARLKPNATVNPSLLLSNRQTALGALVSLWPTLTPTQQNVWCQLAIDHPHIDCYGTTKQLNGFQQFLSNNLNLESIGLPALLDAPEYSLPSPPPEFSINFGSTVMSLVFVTPVDPNTMVLITFSTPLVRSTLVSTRKAKFIIPLGTWLNTTTLDITASFCNYFNIVYADMLAESQANIVIRTKFIDPVTGFSSVYTSTIARVEAVVQSLDLLFDSIEQIEFTCPDYTNFAAWNTLFHLPTNGNPFTSVQLDGFTIKLFGGSDIALDYHSFEEDAGLLGIDDPAGVITSIGNGVFEASVFTYLNLPGLLLIPDYGISYVEGPLTLLLPNVASIGSGGLFSAHITGSFSLPKCASIASYGLDGNHACTEFDLPLCTSIGDYCFKGCNINSTILLPACTALGSTVGNNNVFQNITGKTINLTIPAALMTCNGGNPDGDIVDLQSRCTVNITQV